MDILYLLVPVSLLLVVAIAVVFWWSVKSGQFDDLEGPAYRLMMEDDDRPAEDNSPVKKESGAPVAHKTK
ncbi:cbb3-type cytochrome oxidase assembly protein CcoS [Azospira inquinata]|uniref:Cbb3-type cytochrome oxidase assembly protein CcoS n=1 Tax=Azospira inquinata TaxID=2785627 RepID=A0A975SL38_9RHOO|nr:cbb3-type cytochrome oxidase assembly protein CcoS [Azospira inquinata]QWT46364.1 cbb3-type cytochrome oxidase assembly protein CcoS [Azospira inquinata]QWT48310.1 cbb3-type cytochrome oxidase assembly protein CcoS [Azospira inquinata]